MEAAGVELDTRFQTGLFCEFPNENESLKSLKPLKFLGAGTNQVHGFCSGLTRVFVDDRSTNRVLVEAAVCPPPPPRDCFLRQFGGSARRQDRIGPARSNPRAGTKPVPLRRSQDPDFLSVSRGSR